MDPLSIAGLTIAVLDQLWKIGEGTAQLVSNFRDFDSVRFLSYPSNNLRRISSNVWSRAGVQCRADPRNQDSSILVHKIQDENNRTRALHMLLFEASSVGHH